MRSLTRCALGVFTLLFTFTLHAADGHWVGTIQAPQGAVEIEFDLTGNGGTFSIPARNLQGLPLAAVRVDGDAVTLEIAPNGGGGVFRGKLSGKSISGTYVHGADGAEIPLELTRTGDARVAAAKKLEVGKELEGSWKGALDVNGTQKAIGLDLSRGVLIADGLDIPIAEITRTDSKITLDVKSIGGSWSGALQNGELVGTWTQPGFTGALNFRR